MLPKKIREDYLLRMSILQILSYQAHYEGLLMTKFVYNLQYYLNRYQIFE